MPGLVEVVAERGADRLDAFLKDEGIVATRTLATRLARRGLVRVNGLPARAARALQAGDRVEVEVPEPEPAIPAAESLPLDVVYEDDDLLVVNKAAGMVVHPGAGRRTGTLVNALLARHATWPAAGGPMRPGIVHRLDRGTSGLLIVARTEAAHRDLATQLAARRVKRTYLAIARGALGEAGLVDAPIARDPRDRRRMAVVDGGRPAVTRFRPRQALAGATLLEVELETGRTHQIRVHLAAIGHPLVGDETYGRSSTVIARPALHAWRLEFTHPRTGLAMSFEVEPPPDFTAALQALRA